jgi:hypothetical protein
MLRIRILPLVLVAVALPSAFAQAAQDTSGTGLTIKPIPAKPVPTPFPLGHEGAGRAPSIQFIPAAQMSEKDKLVEAGAESSIQERAHWSDLDFNSGPWSYQQIVCPALPNHLFLQFTRNNGAGDVSMFSASIPRSSDGRVRIIPIERRSYSLFSPAPINALTISAFNHIRAEENADKAPDWLTTGLCYAALAGAHPETVLLADSLIDSSKFPEASPATMRVPPKGGAIIRFADIAAAPRPMQWTLVFNPQGKLLKASKSPAPLITEKAMTQEIKDLKGKPIPQTIVDLNPSRAQ